MHFVRGRKLTCLRARTVVREWKVGRQRRNEKSQGGRIWGSRGLLESVDTGKDSLTSEMVRVWVEELACPHGIKIRAVPPSGCVTLDKSFNLSVPPWSYL